jgi:hypothetical protein
MAACTTLAAIQPGLAMAELDVDQHGRTEYALDGDVLDAFMQSDARVAIICGPLGSGKSKACNLKLWDIANKQTPDPKDGVRRTRFAICRRTYPSLRSSSIRTFNDTFPDRIYGRFVWSQPPHKIVRHGNTEMHCDFLALDDLEDSIEKLRSTEYTGFFFNELQFFDEKIVIDEALSRCGRYPAIKDGACSWAGIVADMNAASEDHWITLMLGKADWPDYMSESDRAALRWPKSWQYFEQPPALVEQRDSSGRVIGWNDNPEAENTKWLGKTYYRDLVEENPSRDWIENRLMNRTVFVADGQPVWPMFRREFHVAREPLRPVNGYDVIVSLDFGRVYPAAIFAQEINQRLYVQHEMLGFNEGATIFAPKVQKFLTQNYPGYTARFVGDPKGRDKGVATEQSSYDIFRSHGMLVSPAPVKGNDISQRVEAVAYALNDNPSGVNYLAISPTCRTLIVGMAGRYHLVKEEKGEFKPKKDKYSNLCDALQYLVIGRGVSRKMIGLEPVVDLRPKRFWYGRKTMRRIVS